MREKRPRRHTPSSREGKWSAGWGPHFVDRPVETKPRQQCTFYLIDHAFESKAALAAGHQGLLISSASKRHLENCENMHACTARVAHPLPRSMDPLPPWWTARRSHTKPSPQKSGLHPPTWPIDRSLELDPPPCIPWSCMYAISLNGTLYMGGVF
jgi:hypothetical protein